MYLQTRIKLTEMENISTKDFEQLEKLLCSKQFEELNPSEKQWILNLISQEEYYRLRTLYQLTNHSTTKLEIEPQPATKARLDKALAAQRQPAKIYRVKIPVYQSVAAAILFFFVGLEINWSRPVQTKIVHNTTKVIKYVDRPVKQILYVNVPVKNEKKNNSPLQNVSTTPATEVSDEKDIIIPESNPEVLRQQEIAMTNINHVLNEKNGSSMSGDTVLQKMMVTIY
jgi:hypothetical protein